MNQQLEIWNQIPLYRHRNSLDFERIDKQTSSSLLVPNFYGGDIKRSLSASNSPLPTPNSRRKVSWTGVFSSSEKLSNSNADKFSTINAPLTRKRRISRAGSRVAYLVRSISSTNLQVSNQQKDYIQVLNSCM